jgi:DNA-directed RNA polymerase subunit alpha
MEEILLPSKIELTPGKSDREATLTVEPCFQGYGTTLGNALRRVMLSSLPGAAVTAVKIKGAQHEFSAIPGVKEDVLEIVLNLKGLRLRVFSDETVRLSLKSSGDKNITAADIEKTQDVEIMNPDLHIATMTDKNADFEMEIFISKGRGFVTTEERAKEKQELGVIAIDSIFTPVREVGYKVENVRVGEITNYDQLVMTIETDGTITPDEAVDQTVKILLDHFSLILHRNASAAPALEAAPAEAAVEAAPAEEAATEPAAEEATEEEGDTKKKAKKAAKKKK